MYQVAWIIKLTVHIHIVLAFGGSFGSTRVLKRTPNIRTRRLLKIGGVELNEIAAKNWLSNLQQPWLLLVDNVDDPEIDVMRVFPGGERGVILITTRNPTNKRYGTEGSRFFFFISKN